MYEIQDLYAVDKNVYAYKCPKCEKLYYPAPMVCEKCRTRRDPSEVIYDDFIKVPLKGKCKLLAYSQVFALPEGFETKSLTFGIVEFDNGIKALGQIRDANVKTGDKLIAETDVIREVAGNKTYGFVFRKGKK